MNDWVHLTALADLGQASAALCQPAPRQCSSRLPVSSADPLAEAALHWRCTQSTPSRSGWASTRTPSSRPQVRQGCLQQHASMLATARLCGNAQADAGCQATCAQLYRQPRDLVCPGQLALLSCSCLPQLAGLPAGTASCVSMSAMQSHVAILTLPCPM